MPSLLGSHSSDEPSAPPFSRSAAEGGSGSAWGRAGGCGAHEGRGADGGGCGGAGGGRGGAGGGRGGGMGGGCTQGGGVEAGGGGGCSTMRAGDDDVGTARTKTVELWRRLNHVSLPTLAAEPAEPRVPPHSRRSPVVLNAPLPFVRPVDLPLPPLDTALDRPWLAASLAALAGRWRTKWTAEAAQQATRQRTSRRRWRRTQRHKRALRSSLGSTEACNKNNTTTTAPPGPCNDRPQTAEPAPAGGPPVRTLLL